MFRSLAAFPASSSLPATSTLARRRTSFALAVLALVPAGAAALAPAARASQRATEPLGVPWHACAATADDEEGAQLDAAGARCATLTVPLDYDRPDGPTLPIAVSRVPASDPPRRRGALLFNPGGPGTPGRGLIAPIAAAAPALARQYDLIGMDPRFVGRSQPIDCHWSTATFLRSAGPDRATFDESVAFAQRLAKQCAAGNERWLPYATTRNTARDMDRLRMALGEERLSYLGVSYGTYLGAVYLQMFGAHADRVVLDSAVDPAVYGPGLLSESAPALQRALRRWASWAAHRDQRFHLGRSRAQVLETVDILAARAAHRPLVLGTYRVDEHVLPYLLLAGLYDDGPESREALASSVQALRDAAHGRSRAPDAGLTALLSALADGTGDPSDSAGTPILCADRSESRDPEAAFAAIQWHRASEPLFGPLVRNVTPCAFWPVDPVEPTTIVANAAPVLMVGTEGDPITPSGGQRAMHRALAGSRLVTLRGAFRHGAWLEAGSACIDRAVQRYLLGGALPADDRRCPRLR